MCNPALVVAGSAATQAYGQIQQGRTAKAEGELAAVLSEDEARAEAAAIRRVGERQRGQTVAALVASGVKVGEGSALEAERAVVEDYTRDEYITLLTGQRRASAYRRAGRDAARAGNVSAMTSLLQAGAGYARASGWGAKGPGFSGSQMPAPVEDRSFYSGAEFRPNRAGR